MLTSRRCLAAGRRGEHSRHYLQALLVQSGERRNAENLSETVPASARGMQRFLTDSPWEDDVIIGRLQEYLRSRLEYPEAVWVLDGSDFPKQGPEVGGSGPAILREAGQGGQLPSRDVPGLRQPAGPGPGGQKGFICRRAGPRTKTGVRRQGFRRRGRATGRRPNWRWRCCSGPWSGAI